MPTIEYKCLQCDHAFQRLVLKGDEGIKKTCPKCQCRDVKAVMNATRLFEGIADFSTMANDPN